MWVGIAIVVLMGIFPPWVGFDETTPHYLGYKFLLSPPDNMWLLRHRDSINIDHVGIVDFSRLLIQWVMVSVVAVGLIITFKDKRQKDKHIEQRLAVRN